MNRIDACFLGDAHYSLDIEVGGERTPGRAEFVALVGLEAMQGEAVLLGVYSDRADTEFRCPAHHANCDLAAIGNEKLLYCSFHRLM